MSSYRIIGTDGGELYHYGVMGMKWGVRRYQNEDGSLTDAGKKRYAKQQVKERKKQAKYSSTMSDDELNDLINRLRKEEEVKKLVKQRYRSSTKQSLDKGADFVGSTIKKGAQTVGTAATVYALGVIVNHITGKNIIKVDK